MRRNPTLLLIALFSTTCLNAQYSDNNTEIMIETQNGNFSIIDQGSGDVVLFLHGFPDSKELWSNQIRALSKQGYRVIAPDLRGYGKAPRPLEKEQYAMPILMSDVIGIMDTLNLKKAHLVGHDFGAGLAWSLAKYYNHRFNSLTVLSVGAPGNPGWTTIEQRQKSWYFYFFLQEGLAEKEMADYNWKFSREAFKTHPHLEDVIEKFQQPHSLTTALNWYRGNLGYLIAQPNVDYAPTNTPPKYTDEKITIPVMGIWSDGDDFLTEKQMTLSSQFVNDFTYHKIEDAGHWLMLDKPVELNQLLIEFLDKL